MTQSASPESQAQIQSLLRAHPEAIDQLKTLLAQQLQKEGSAVEPQAITDAVLAARLQSDAAFRTTAVRYLVEHGTITEEQARNILGPAGESTPGSNDAPTKADTAPSRGTGAATHAAASDQSFDDSSLNPRTVAQPNPYPTLPSTKALYAQFPDDAKGLKRFGSEIFRPDAVGLAQFPMDLPAGPDYVLGPGDTVTLDIWGGVSQKVTQTVDREGRITLPEAGPLMVAGLSLAQAQKLVQAKLEPQFRNAHVDLSVSRIRSLRVYVVGDVQRPGAYDISALSTPLNALYAAGGPTPTGSLRVVKHYRGKQLLGQMDLYDLLLRGVRQGIEQLQPGDTILVPPVGPLVAVTGMVRRPAIYELLAETQLADVLEMAGGVPVSASMDEIKVERIEAHAKRVTLNVKLPVGAGDRPLRDMVGSFWVKDGDRVAVSSILPYSDKTIYLEGHVYRPGSYPYQDGMKITDLVRSYQDVLPEPANHAEIVRLQPPDFHPVTIEFNLASALAGDETVTLQQFDTVRLADRIEERLCHDYVTEEDRAFIERMDMFFLATADRDGRPNCSYKGGDPGFVRVIDPGTIAFPNYDGNGMYLSMGNTLENANVGMLFIDFETGDLLGLTGTTEVLWDADQDATGFKGAQRMWKVKIEAGWRRRAAVPLAWTLISESPMSLATGTWAEAA